MKIFPEWVSSDNKRRWSPLRTFHTIFLLSHTFFLPRSLKGFNHHFKEVLYCPVFILYRFSFDMALRFSTTFHLNIYFLRWKEWWFVKEKCCATHDDDEREKILTTHESAIRMKFRFMMMIRRELENLKEKESFSTLLALWKVEMTKKWVKLIVGRAWKAFLTKCSKKDFLLANTNKKRKKASWE